MSRFLILLGFLAIPANHRWLGRPATEGDLLRGYALGRCLSAAYKGTAMAVDADRAASAYLEMGSLTGDGYHKVMALAERASESPPSAQPVHNDDPNDHSDHLKMFRCIEFYESPALKKLVNKTR